MRVTTHTYRCGALCVTMTASQAARWNGGTLRNGRGIRIHVPVAGGTDTITLAEAARREGADSYYDDIHEEAVLCR